MKTSSSARVLAGAASLSGLLFASSANAQRIDVVNETSLPRFDRNGAQITKRAVTQRPEAINRVDCDDDQRIGITLQMADLARNGALEAWAGLSGADCKAQMRRSGSTQVCWPLVTNIPLGNVAEFQVAVRRLLSGVPSATAPDSTARICGAVDRTRLAIHFLYFAPGERATAAVDKSIDIDADTIGPPAAVNLAAVPASDGVELSWANATEPVFVRSDVFCTKVDASRACSTVFGQGAVPDESLRAESLCAQIPGSETLSRLIRGHGSTPLSQGTTYAFAVSRVDDFMNAGPFSNAACSQPGPPSPDDSGCSAHGGVTSKEATGGSFVAFAIGAFAWSRRRRRAATVR